MLNAFPGAGKLAVDTLDQILPAGSFVSSLSPHFSLGLGSGSLSHVRQACLGER